MMEYLDAHQLSQKKIVLLIGNLTQEGVTTKIRTLGYDYKQKLLYSSNENWLKIVKLIRKLREKDNLVAIFVHFTPSAIFRAAHKDFEATWEKLIVEFSQSNAYLFVYEDNLLGKFTPEDERWILNGPYRSLVSDTEANDLIRKLYDAKINVLPYKKRIDLTISIQQILDENESGVFFRLFVPNGRLQANQVESFLNLFENYLRQVEQVYFSIDSSKTEHGTLYKFKSKGKDINLQNLENALSNFENFMDLVESDITKATQILVEMGINKSNANELTSKYSKLYRRIRLDIQHEFESKSLALRQSLESEILDFSEANITSPNRIINSTNLLSMPTSPQSILLNLGNISIQNSQIIHSEIAQIVGGDITYNENDQRLIELFEKYVDHFEAINLRTSLEQLKDESTPKDERLTAKQKIVAFLYKILPKAGEKAIDILMDYIIKTSIGL